MFSWCLNNISILSYEWAKSGANEKTVKSGFLTSLDSCMVSFAPLVAKIVKIGQNLFNLKSRQSGTWFFSLHSATLSNQKLTKWNVEKVVHNVFLVMWLHKIAKIENDVKTQDNCLISNIKNRCFRKKSRLKNFGRETNIALNGDDQLVGRRPQMEFLA